MDVVGAGEEEDSIYECCRGRGRRGLYIWMGKERILNKANVGQEENCIYGLCGGGAVFVATVVAGESENQTFDCCGFNDKSDLYVQHVC